MTLELGPVTQAVEVQASASAVELRSIGIGAVVDNQRILELPLNGRQATDLILLAGAALPYPGVALAAKMQTGVSIAVAGGRLFDDQQQEPAPAAQSAKSRGGPEHRECQSVG